MDYPTPPLPKLRWMLFAALLAASSALGQTSIITTAAGGYLGDGGPAVRAAFNIPQSVAAGPGRKSCLIDRSPIRLGLSHALRRRR